MNFAKLHCARLLFCFFSLSTYLFSHGQNSLGIFDNHTDVGHPKMKGNASYDAASQTYQLSGGGYNIWFNRDEFHYLYKKLKGDFILTADFAFTGANNSGNNHSKIGWMVRENTDENAASVNGTFHHDGLMVLQWRNYRGMFMRDPEDEIFYPKKGSQTMQLSRRGNTITMKLANPGEPLQTVGSYELKDAKDELLAGIFICSHDSDKIASAKVWNVRIDKPVYYPFSSSPSAKNKNPTEVYGSRLEILNVADGNRKAIYEAKEIFEAPNWMPDGKSLLFNRKGSLYSIPTNGGEPAKLNTGAANRNNNDHVISFDGKMLGISSQREGMPGWGSTVYTVPLSGGEPTLVTDSTPSYLHGWSTDGKSLMIVAQRNGNPTFNLFKVNLKDRKETNLTPGISGHVDGPEFSPDGKYIYYNGNQSGTMQVWRMKPDGSEKEQLTFDEYHNWFPHISPDGKMLLMISFLPDIDPNSHPAFKQVMLRVMRLDGAGAPRVVAHLFGGQGTINVPSWSPDSKQLAFVSNSEPVN